MRARLFLEWRRFSMRNRMIAGNWKMNKTYDEGVVLAQGLVD